MDMVKAVYLFAFLSKHQQKVLNDQNSISWTTQLKMDKPFRLRERETISDYGNPVKGFGVKFTRNFNACLGFDFMMQESNQLPTTVKPCLNCRFIIHNPCSSNYKNILLF